MKKLNTPLMQASKSIIIFLGMPLSTLGIYFYFTKETTLWLIIGLLVFGAGLILALMDILKEQRSLKLIQTGNIYDAVVTEIKEKENGKSGKETAAKFICKYSDGKTEKTVESDFYLLPSIEKPNSYKAKVYVDKINYDNYCVKIRM